MPIQPRPQSVTTVSSELKYDGTSMLLHWVTAALVITLWTLGQTLSDFPKGAPRFAALSVHILLGIAVGVVLVVRVIWRLRAGRRLPPADSGWQGRLAKGAHHGLYWLLALTVALGLVRGWLHGNAVFSWFTFPKPGFSTRTLTSTIGGLHGDLADIVVIVAGLHAAAALMHHYVLRDSVLRRMLPGGNKG